ncbi:MAG: hypothetical protein QOK37_3334 [Thermoanaerobaculia bacterium]|jgi:hypothetical protein|nr:hypothetical protein [Thermoanaerobaculia bacterium]
MLGLLLLTAITTFTPAAPTVGDPITIEFALPTTVDASPDYEVVSRAGNRVVIRTFVPHTIAVKGQAADGPVSVMIPIHSVLKPDDQLEPAPLKPPREEPWPRMPFVAIGVAALAAAALWTAVVMIARRRAPKPVVVVVPAEEFRARLQSMRRAVPPMPWAQLAIALRRYLAAVRADLGAELTTAELVARIDDAERGRSDHASVIREILHQGDLEKFSPWGAAPADFSDALTRALELPSWAEPQPVETAGEEAAA